MAQQLLLGNDGGAAAVLGATTLSAAASEYSLGSYMTPQLFEPGKTIGEALLLAKQELAAANAGDTQQMEELMDVFLGWTMLGDPTMVVQPK
jgi:hypothetical protein